MRPLIDIQVVNVFVCGASMIDLIKIHAVEIGRGIRHGVLLVHKGGGGGIPGADSQRPSPGIQKRDLVKIDLSLCDGKRQIRPGEKHVRRVPFEHVAVKLFIGIRAAVSVRDRHGALGNVAVKPHRGNSRAVFKRQRHGIARFAAPDGGGKAGCAKV